MVVYIEQVIIDNLLMTSVISYLSYKITRQAVDCFLIAIVACIGTIFAIFYPLLTLPSVVILLLKILLGIVLGWILFFDKFKKTLGVCVFFLSTFLLGGLVFVSNFVLVKDINTALTSQAMILPMWSISIVLFILVFFVGKVIDKTHKAIDTVSCNRVVEIFLQSKSITINGFVDTGNKLYYKNQPVCVINRACIIPMLPFATRCELHSVGDNGNKNYSKKSDNYSTISYVEINTIAGLIKMPLIKTDKIVVYYNKNKHIFYKAWLALSSTPIVDYDLLLPAKFA